MKNLAFAVILLGQVTSVHAQKRPCSVAEAERADREASILRRWDDLRKSYKLYGHCDDGSIGEGYSESVARILVDHWNTLSQLDAIGKNDSKFYRFVLRHIDATLDSTDLEKIRTYASIKCPTGLDGVCADVKKAADRALKE